MKLKFILFCALMITTSMSKAAFECDSLVNFYEQNQVTIDSIVTKFNSLKNQGCYGEVNDQTSWVIEFNKATSDLSLGNLITTARSGVDYLTEHLESTSELPKVKQLTRSLKEWSRNLNGGNAKQIRSTIHPDSWSYDNGSYTFGPSDKPFAKIDQIIIDGCFNNNTPSECKKNLSTVEELSRFLFSMEKISGIVFKGKLEETVYGLTLLDSRWDTYFNDARPQNFLENIFNTYYSNKRSKKTCENKGEVSQESCLLSLGESFYQPPSSQIILLNPSVALEYIPDSPDGSQLQESLVLEIAGINRWKWKGDKMKSNFGASIIATYSDREDVDDIGYGLLFHFGSKFSIGATKRSGGKEGFFINVDLRDYLFSWTESKKGQYESYKKIYDKISN